MTDQRVVLVDAPEIAERGGTLFPGSVVLYANGQLPPEAMQSADVVVVSADASRIAELCAALAKAGTARIRGWNLDISGFTDREQVKANVGSLLDYVPEAATADSSDAAPPDHAEIPKTAKIAQTAPSDEIDRNHPAWENIPEDDAPIREVRNRSANKRAAHETEVNAPHGEWPAPVDFWGTEGGLPEFLPQYLPPAIEPYVTDQASRAGLDPAQVALNCYVACAALLRTGIELQMQEGSEDGRTWKEKPILWGAVVGDPSTGKGPALDIALHKFYKIASVLRAKDEAAWQRYDEESKIHEKRMQSYIAEAAKSPMAVKPEAPAKPPRERLWTDDVTKEVVAKLLTENPRGKIAIVKDELAGWFGSFDAYGNGKSDKDRPDWLSFYESKERYIDRAMEGRSYHVPSWGGIILGGIQPEVLQRISGKLGADGMLQRFQIIVSKPKRQVPKRPADAEATQQWHRVLENLADMHSTGRPVQLSPDAAAYMDEQVKWIAQAMQAGLQPPLQAVLGKWEGLFGRLMIVSHCIESAALGMHTPAPFVSLKTAEQAWGWMRWILWPHAVQFFGGLIDQGEELRSVRAFAEYVLAREINRIKPYQLTANWSHYRAYKTIQQRREFWARVEQSGWARPCGTFDRSGQISSEYEINPEGYAPRFSEVVAASKRQVDRYRQAMHPAMLAAQSRQPGED